MKNKTKPQEKAKFVAKGKNKSAPKTKSVQKQHSNKPSLKQKAARTVQSIERGALAPSMDNEFISVSDKFRFGEFKDGGITKETSAGVRQNQIFLQLPVNPRRLLAVAKLNDVLKDNVPTVYKCEPYNENSYQYRIDSAELVLSGVMPSSVSGEVCAFFTSNLSRTINETNVLDAYESSKHKIQVSGKQVKSLKFSTGTLFINDDMTSDMAPDPSLCYAGLLVVFVRSPVVTAVAVASSSSADPNFSYLGPMVQAQLKMKCSYKGYEYAPQNIDSKSLGSKYSQEMFTTMIVPSQIVTSGGYVQCIPTFSVPPELQGSVLTTAYAETYGGEWIGTTGDKTRPIFNMRLHNIPPSLGVSPVLLPGVIGTIDLFSWDSFTGFIQSAVAKLIDLPNQVNAKFVDLFGDVAGNALYSIAKWTVTLGISALTGGVLVNSSVVGHDPQGYPLDSSGNITNGYVEPGSFLWQQTLNYYLATNQGAYIQSVLAQGVEISFMNIKPWNYWNSDAPVGSNNAYVGSSGRLGAWTKPVYGYTEVKPSFGQPSSIGSTVSRPAEIKVSQLASDHVTKRLGATVAQPISFFMYVPAGGSVKVFSTEATQPSAGVSLPKSFMTTIAQLQSYYKFCDYNVTGGGYAIQRLTGHLSFFSGFGASFVTTTGQITVSELLALMVSAPDGMCHPADRKSVV